MVVDDDDFFIPANKESKEIERKKKHEICTDMTKHSKYSIYKLAGPRSAIGRAPDS